MSSNIKFSIRSILGLKEDEPEAKSESTEEANKEIVDVVSVDSGNEVESENDKERTDLTKEIAIGVIMNNVTHNHAEIPASYPNYLDLRPRPRTSFTSKQLMVLENVFKNSEYLTRLDRVDLALKLDLNEKQIRVWFQNRRVKKNREIFKK